MDTWSEMVAVMTNLEIMGYVKQVEGGRILTEAGQQRADDLIAEFTIEDRMILGMRFAGVLKKSEGG